MSEIITQLEEIQKVLAFKGHEKWADKISDIVCDVDDLNIELKQEQDENKTHLTRIEILEESELELQEDNADLGSKVEHLEDEVEEHDEEQTTFNKYEDLPHIHSLADSVRFKDVMALYPLLTGDIPLIGTSNKNYVILEVV